MLANRGLVAGLPGLRPCLAVTKAVQQRCISVDTKSEKQEGDISAAFASLSGKSFIPLEPRFARIKQALVAGNTEAFEASWHRLLGSLREENRIIAQQKSNIVPEINFDNLLQRPQDFVDAVQKRGVAVVRNVIPQKEALAAKELLRGYIRRNPHTKAFPPENPQVYELYWSPAQIKARSNPRLLAAQTALMSIWHSKDPEALVSTEHPAIYADRLRMRLPGDTRFALGPHVDGGSCERWEAEGYGRGGVYDKIWQGRWEEYDPWEVSCRLPVRSSLYDGVGACSMFRMFQGWLAMSDTGPHEGTLLVNPLLRQATAYYLLRPFFKPRANVDSASGRLSEEYLAPANWELDLSSTNSWLHGATPGQAQELRETLHPHLNLAETMVHVPKVEPGDYVAWHCDTVHAVDNVHQGSSDSSVLYIPTCPLTVENAKFLATQRQRFLDGTPSPDFGGGDGERDHIGRPGVKAVEAVDAELGMQAFGLGRWDQEHSRLSASQQELLKQANAILGFN